MFAEQWQQSEVVLPRGAKTVFNLFWQSRIATIRLASGHYDRGHIVNTVLNCSQQILFTNLLDQGTLVNLSPATVQI